MRSTRSLSSSQGEMASCQKRHGSKRSRRHYGEQGMISRKIKSKPNYAVNYHIAVVLENATVLVVISTYYRIFHLARARTWMLFQGMFVVRRFENTLDVINSPESHTPTLLPTWRGRSRSQPCEISPSENLGNFQLSVTKCVGIDSLCMSKRLEACS